MSRSESNKSSNYLQSPEMEVILRLKPLPGSGQSIIVGAGPRNITIARPISNHLSSDVNEYQFDWILPETSSQTDTFKKSCPTLLKNFFSGHNSLLLCYGQSGSGKTFTISGDKKAPGILQSILCSVFRSINKNTFKFSDKNTPYSVVIPTKKRVKYTVMISYMECYDDKLYDLLKSGSRPVQLDNQTEMEVYNIFDAFKYLELGMKNRKVYDTQTNRDSNRSHGIFTIKLIQTPDDISSEELSKNPSLSVISSFRIVDLAAFDNKYDSKGHLIKDYESIQRSLSTLGKCFNAMKSNASTEEMYNIINESELTKIMQDYFLGKSKAMLIVTISSNSTDYEETIKALSFSYLVKKNISSSLLNNSTYPEDNVINSSIQDNEISDDTQLINGGTISSSSIHNNVEILDQPTKSLSMKPDRPSIQNSDILGHNNFASPLPNSNRHLDVPTLSSPSSDSNLLSPLRIRRTPSRLQYDVMDLELSVRSEVADEMSNNLYELELFYKSKYEQYYEALINSIVLRMERKIDDLIEDIQNKDIENESLLRTIKKKDSTIENLKYDILAKDKLLEDQRRALYFEIEEKDLSVQDIKVKYRQELEILKEELEKLSNDYKKKLRKSKEEIENLRKKLKEKEKKKSKKESLKKEIKEEKESKKKKSSKKRSLSDISNYGDKENNDSNLLTPKKQKKISKKPKEQEEYKKKTVVFTSKEYKTRDGQIIRTPLRRRLRSHKDDT